MAQNLESALVIVLRETIPWEAALDAPASGTLTKVTPAAPFNALEYQTRDRELGFRDLMTAAAIVEVSMEISDVWNYTSARPTLQGPASTALPFHSSEISFQGVNAQTNSQVRHVGHASIPFDAFRYTDKDLYARDVLIYEVLARAAASVFVAPPISAITSSGTVPSTGIWSLASGTSAQADINAALPLNRDLFRLPDQNLTDRDNQLAGYAARVIASMRNPFVAADRLFVRLTGVQDREAEVYVFQRGDWLRGTSYRLNDEVFYVDQYYRSLTSDNFAVPTTTASWLPIGTQPTRRVFLMEPTLGSRNRIVYNVAQQTLQWFRETSDLLHVPHIFAFSIPGIVAGQTLDTLAQVPDEKDVMFWRRKAGQVLPVGFEQVDVTALAFTANDSVSGGYTQREAASLTVPSSLTAVFPGSGPNGNYRVSVLVEPSPLVEIVGAQNITGTSGTLAGASFQVSVANGEVLVGVTYAVVGGTSITYNGHVYYPDDTFTGVTGVTTYVAQGGSTLRQYQIGFRLALPRATWALKIEYANLQDSVTGFGVRAQYFASGRNAVAVLEDTIPLPYMTEEGDALPAGTLVSSQEFGFDTHDNNEFTLLMTWTSSVGQLHIRKLSFIRRDATEAQYSMSGTLGVGHGVGSFSAGASLDVTGQAFLPDVMTFDFTNTGTLTAPISFTLRLENDAAIPLQVKQLQVQTIGTYASTPVAETFQWYRQELLDRIEHIVQQSYNRAVRAYGTSTPQLRSDDNVWNTNSTENWMSFIETQQPRLRKLVDVAGDAISPGRQYEVTVGPVQYGNIVYQTGQKFYGATGTTVFTGAGTIDQVGCFFKAGPGHLGKPALVPAGLEFDFNGGTVTAVRDAVSSDPLIVALLPWMLDVGIYVAGSELWTPDQLIAVPIQPPPPPSDEPLQDEDDFAFLDEETGEPIFDDLKDF